MIGWGVTKMWSPGIGTVLHPDVHIFYTNPLLFAHRQTNLITAPSVIIMVTMIMSVLVI